MTNFSFSFGSEATPRPRSTVLPVPVAPWTLADVCVAAQRHAQVTTGTGLAAISGGAGTRMTAGPRLTMQSQQLVRNPIVRKHNVYLTRVNAGGDGASGPYPEREPA